MSCPYCFDELFSEKPSHSEQKRKLCDSSQFDSISDHAQDGDIGDKKRIKLSDPTDSIAMPLTQDEASLHKEGQSDSTAKDCSAATDHCESSSEPKQSETNAALNQSETSHHQPRDTESNRINPLESSKQDKTSLNKMEQSGDPIEIPNQEETQKQSDPITTGSTSLDEQEHAVSVSNSSHTSVTYSESHSSSKPGGESNPQRNKRRRRSSNTDEESHPVPSRRASGRLAGRGNTKSQQTNHSLQEPEVYCAKDHDESEFLSIQFNTLIFEEYWTGIKCISIGIDKQNIPDVDTYIVPFESTQTIQLESGKFVILSGTLKYPKRAIPRGVICFPYKYLIYSKDNTDCFEHLNDISVHSSDHTDYNRFFIWYPNTDPISQTDNRTYQQYDVMILPYACKESGIVISLIRYITGSDNVENIKFQNLFERKLITLQAFLPSYLGLGHSPPCKSLEDFISQFTFLINTLVHFRIHNREIHHTRQCEFRDIKSQKITLVESWMETTYTSDRLTQLDPKDKILHFYLACYLVQSYNIHKHELILRLMDLVDGSIESILKDKSYVLDTSVYTDKFMNSIITSVAGFTFKKAKQNGSHGRFLTLLPIYHCISKIEENAVALLDKSEYNRNEYWGVPKEEYRENISVIRDISFDLIKKALALAEYDHILYFTIVRYTLTDQNVSNLCKHFDTEIPRFPLSALMSALLFYSDKGIFSKLRSEVFKFLKLALTKDPVTSEIDDMTRLMKLTLFYTAKLSIHTKPQFIDCLTILSRGLILCDSQSPTIPSILIDRFKQFFSDFVIKWTQQKLTKNTSEYKTISQEIKFWEEMIENFSFPSSIKWLDMIESYLVKRFKDTKCITQQYIIDLFIEYHTKGKHPAILQEIFLKELTSRLELMKPGDKNEFVQRLYTELSQTDQLEKVNNIFSNILLEEQSNFEFNPISHFLRWTSWDIYFSFLCLDNTHYVLSEAAAEMLLTSSTQFVSLLEDIQRFKITGMNLDLIEDNKKYFLKLVKRILESKHNSEYSYDDIYRKLETSSRMYEWVGRHTHLLSHFHAFLENLQSINIESISTFMSVSVEKMSISDVCIANGDSCRFSLSHEEVNQIVTSPVFDSISRVCVSLPKSRILFQIFNSVINKKEMSQQTSFDITNFFKDIWKPAWKSCLHILEEFSKRTILISKLRDYFDFGESNEVIFTDLESFDLCCKQYQGPPRKSNNLLKQCANKIHLYSKLQNCSEAANLITKLKEELEIKESFEIIENMKNIEQTFENKQLKELTDKVINLASDLRNLSKSNLDVIQAIIDRIDFIMWIRSNLKDLNELKTFVDISLTTCGGNPVDVDRITCLSSVCTNFAPIIFQIDENTSYETLIARCRQVMESVERNRELTKLLRQVGENVTFWEEMKQSHGSVEETTLMQLASIMKSGQFDVKLGDSLNLCDIVSLSVERENGEKRLYSLEQLREFRSKLMLVVSKTELPGLDTYTGSYENSQLFTHKLDTLTEIATIVIQLAETGNQRYLKYELHSDCNQLEDTLMELKDKLRNTLEDWRANVEAARNRHYFLNYYTISQIVFLQKGIKSFIEEREDRDLEQLYHLLGLLNPDVSKQDIQQALEQSNIVPIQNPSFKASSESAHDFSKQSLSTAISTHYTQSYPTHPNDLPAPKLFYCPIDDEPQFPESFSFFEKQFAHEVSVEADLSIGLVIRGINAQTNNNEGDILKSKLILWCLEHEADEDTEPMDIDPVEEIEKSNVEKNNFDSVINLSKLGYFLEEIFRLNGNKIRSRRELPYNLKSGSPNLVVIPSAGMLEFVLSLYMSDNDKLPLPYYHEILICTPQTRLEEIEIFWRRAVTIPDRLNLFLFCLIGIENLSYDVAVQAVAKLKYLQQSKNIGTTGKEEFGYKLILICSEEREGYSYMAAALDDCKIPILFRIKSQNVIEYVIGRLSPVYPRTIYKSRDPAWMVDRERKRVRLVVSDSVGAGKSLYINNLKSDLLSQGIVSEEEMEQSAVTVAIHGKQASEEHLAAQLLKRRVSGVKHGVMYHVDIASTVQLCLEPILFKLLILGGICNRSGELWHCRGRDYYVIEMTLGSDQVKFTSGIYPCSFCVQPFKVAETSDKLCAQTIDLIELRKEQYQRVCLYLRRLDKGKDMDNFTFTQVKNVPRISQPDSMHILLKHCGIIRPSWSEVRNFVSFLGRQLSDCDNSDYCQSGNVMEQEWKGFKSFVVKFMILMSRDFATPSLRKDNGQDDRNVLTHFEIIERRKWENNSHPYIFFNPDGHTMTFLGFHISRQGHLVDSDNPSHVIEANIMHPQLLQILTANQVNLQENFNKLDKLQKIMKLAGVIGIEWIADPDPGYVLTLDNMRKILAILMRFRCNIPVIIMGETGCGKTRLIQFMCSLQALQTGACNMLILKVHGGTTETDVMSKVEEAEKLAERNYAAHQIDTVLFFDEANTSPAIGLIKEIMCDRRMYGRHIRTDIGLQFIAACNPYRRHTEEMLRKLSCAGLGFFTKASETTDRLGDIPLRELVYRVMELPASLRPLVWDFGQLSNSIEKTYTREIVARHLRERNSPIEARDEIVDAISDVLAGAQNYMRERKDECSFVSLRDVERAMRVMLWFYSKLEYFRPEEDTFTDSSDEFSSVEGDRNFVKDADDGEVVRRSGCTINDITYSLMISLAVCYRARLQERGDFDLQIIGLLRYPLTAIDDLQTIHREVDRCQGLLLDEMTIGANIAKNTALKENVFMMFVCIELKIPLFVIGKPGSSKSLAKSIISNSMQGSRCPDGSILQNFKQVQIMSYQCSQLSTADGIIGVFNSCSNLQRKTGSNKFTACVVLDEVGLAEDSPLLPLKVLHPLLEDSSYGSVKLNDVEEHAEFNAIHLVPSIDQEVPIQIDETRDRVAFIAISNWSLDPAKMNRGIMLLRGDPDLDELMNSARGICQSTSTSGGWGILKSIENKIKFLAKAYIDLTIVDRNRDYYGLRDFYSLVKMLVFFCNKYETNLNQVILEHAVKRNFGGLSDVDPLLTFLDRVKLTVEPSKKGPDSTPLGLISANLKNLSRSYHGETRYLLLLTENYAALNILLRSPDMWPKQQDIESIRVIFGSSFPCDQEYSAVCRNINRIKVCMESGKTVILLNLENLYESLYDALNQYYMEMNNQRYVDLGLGTHRMKCRVHNDFKLIVVADKQTVQERFPTPLINRLEKHILTMSTVLTEDELIISKQLADWADKFSTLDKTHFCGIQKKGDFTVGDCFIGYHNDTPSSIVFHVMKEMYPEGMPTESRIDTTAVLERSQTQLLRMATTDAVLRVKNSLLSLQSEQIIAEYFKLQLGSLEEYLSQVLSGICGSETGTHLTLATTHSRLLTERDIDQLQQRLSTDTDSLQIRSLSLQQFQTEQQFIREIQKFLRGEDSERERRETTHRKILLVQCERGTENGKLIACARHKTVDELKDWREEQRGELKCEVFLLFLVQLNREAHGSKFMSFCGGDWNTVHIDDVRSLDYTEMPPISQLIGTHVYQLFDGHAMVSVGFLL